MRAQWQTPKTRIKEPQTLLNGACLLVCPFVCLSISLLGRTCVFQPSENAGSLFCSVVSFAGPYEAPWPFSQALKKLCRRFLRRLGPSKAPSAVFADPSIGSPASEALSAVWQAMQDEAKPAATPKRKVQKAGESFYNGFRSNAWTPKTSVRGTLNLPLMERLFCLSVCLSVCLPVCMPVCLSVCLSLLFSLSGRRCVFEPWENAGTPF